MKDRVVCYEGYKAEETPRAFLPGERRVEVVRVLDRWREVEASFPSVKTEQFRFLEDVSLHCLLELYLRGAGLQGRGGVQGVQLEEISVRSGRRAGAAIALFPEIVRSLERSPRDGLRRDFRGIGPDIPDDPMDPGSPRGIRVIDDQGERSGFCRDVPDRERWIPVCSVARVLRWDHSIILKCLAREMQLVHCPFLRVKIRNRKE